METQLQATLIQKISETYRAALNLADTAKENSRAALMKARECGLYLTEAKTTAGHGGWIEWFEANRQAFADLSIKTATNYMRLAAMDEEAFATAINLKHAYTAIGILPEPHRDGHDQQSHGEPCKWLSYASKAWADLERVKESRPFSEWPAAQRITLKETLKPLAELYDTL